MRIHRPFALAFVLAAPVAIVATCSTRAHADPQPASVDLAAFLLEGEAWLDAQARASTRAARLADADATARARALATPAEAPPEPLAPRKRDPYFYPVPRLTVVARDWSEAHALRSREVLGTDRVRTRRSTRVLFW